jgi:multisubunit Na+/H+ antiporter MnhB subunit
MQTRASLRRKRLASGLMITAALLLAMRIVAGLVAPEVALPGGLLGIVPALLFTVGFQFWYRADRVFDRGFEPEDDEDTSDQPR